MWCLQIQMVLIATSSDATNTNMLLFVIANADNNTKVYAILTILKMLSLKVLIQKANASETKVYHHTNAAENGLQIYP